MKFKSYYVVWKPEQYIQISKRKFYRLNRTMQYGNKNLNKKIRISFFRLNRTMQYGNLCSPPAFVIKYRLNRTMQYGNGRKTR